GCVCAAGAVEDCNTGLLGACAAGSHQCNADGMGWGACVADAGPVAEVCGDGIDNDCDGVVDNGCVCAAGAVEACNTGLLGACAAGTHQCNATGMGWSDCVADAEPIAEVCGDGIDNDCDGVVDDGCPEVCGD